MIQRNILTTYVNFRKRKSNIDLLRQKVQVRKLLNAKNATHT